MTEYKQFVVRVRLAPPIILSFPTVTKAFDLMESIGYPEDQYEIFDERKTMLVRVYSEGELVDVQPRDEAIAAYGGDDLYRIVEPDEADYAPQN